MKNFTSSWRALMLCLFINALFLPAFSQQIEKSIVLSNNDRIGFLEYKPANYATEGNVKHPVIIFLHGIGERGNGTTELRNVARIGLPRMIKNGHNMKFTWNGKTETFLVVSPQCPRKYGMWPELLVNGMIEYVKKNLRVDPDRIYLTGLSMGGGGTYRFISRQQKQAELPAAAATICAPCTFEKGENVAKAKLPLWSFHAANDSIALASCTDRAIRRINEANPEVKPLKTIWPDGGHGVWDRVYADTNHRYNNVINIYEWFLGQNRTKMPNKIPVAKAGKPLLVHPRIGEARLDATASYDRDGKLVRYVWKKIDGPKAGKITTVMGSAPVTTVTGLTKTGVYKYELAVVDDRASYTKDTLIITVSNDAPLPNVPDTSKPVTPAPDTTVKPPVVIPAPDTTQKPPVVTPAPDTTKPIPAPKPDTVKPVPSPKPDTAKPANKPPVARVTPDQSIPIEWNYFPSVSGYPSTDEDGWIALFTWQKISGPDSYRILNPRKCRTRIVDLVPGTYVFRVTAYDNKGASSFADVKITMTTKEERKKAAEAAKATTTAATVSQSAVVEAVPLTHVGMPSQISLSPNPAYGMVNLVYTSNATGKSVINIFDVTGKLIKSIPFYKSEGVYRHNLEISQLISGIYYIEVRTGNTIGMQTKLMKR